MNHKKWVVALALIATALILTHLPVSEADAAASASDFQIEGSTLTKYRGSDERVTIPDTVEVVGESAFENNQKVQFVVVPNVGEAHGCLCSSGAVIIWKRLYLAKVLPQWMNMLFQEAPD